MGSSLGGMPPRGVGPAGAAPPAQVNRGGPFGQTQGFGVAGMGAMPPRGAGAPLTTAAHGQAISQLAEAQRRTTSKQRDLASMKAELAALQASGPSQRTLPRRTNCRPCLPRRAAGGG